MVLAGRVNRSEPTAFFLSSEFARTRLYISFPGRDEFSIKLLAILSYDSISFIFVSTISASCLAGVMRRGQVAQSTNQQHNVMNIMPMEIQHSTTSRQDAIVDIAFAIESLKAQFEKLLGPHPPNDQFTQAHEAPPPSPRPTPCAQNVPTCLDYPTVGHLDGGETYNELSVPVDPFANNGHFANISYPVEPRSVAIDPNSPYEDGNLKGKKKGKMGKKTKKDVNKAENIIVDESSTFRGEPEIQYPEIQYTPRDGSTTDQPDLGQATRVEHQFTVRVESPTMPSKIIVEF